MKIIGEYQVGGGNFIRENQVGGGHFIREYHIGGVNVIGEYQIDLRKFSLGYQIVGWNFLGTIR